MKGCGSCSGLRKAGRALEKQHRRAGLTAGNVPTQGTRLDEDGALPRIGVGQREGLVRIRDLMPNDALAGGMEMKPMENGRRLRLNS